MLNSLQLQVKRYLVIHNLSEIQVNHSGISKITDRFVYFDEGFPNPPRMVEFDKLSIVEDNLTRYVLKTFN